MLPRNNMEKEIAKKIDELEKQSKDYLSLYYQCIGGIAVLKDLVK